MDTNSTYLITTDDPLMGAIGLSSFTFETLEKWMDHNDGSNLQYLDIASAKDMVFEDTKDWSTTFNVMRDLLYWPYDIDGIDLTKLGGPNDWKALRFTGFRKYGSEEEFKDITNGWTNNKGNWHYRTTGDNGVNYSIDDLNISSLRDDNNKVSYTDKYAFIIKKINDEVNDPNATDSNTLKARKKLIKDILVGKDGVCYWDSSVPFRMNEGESCRVTVRFKLQLFGIGGNKPQSKNGNNVGIVKPYIIGEQRNLGGVHYEERDADDRSVAINSDNPEFKIGAELDTKYVPYTNKFTPHVTQMAVMTSDLAPASAPEKGAMADRKDYVQSNDKGYQPSWGTARPIGMDGKNRDKWGPEWKYSAGCDENEKKEMVEWPVQNKFTDTAFNEGEYVMLIQTDGVWQPMKQEQNSITERVVETDVSNWHFTYMVSNVDFFFRDNSEAQARFTFSAYEQAFWNKYYQVGNHDTSLVPNYVTNGYAQLTSWDFMGHTIGGLRTNGHALGNTQFALRSDGEIDPIASEQLSFLTGPFFGCVFPDGYDLGSKFDEYVTNGIDETGVQRGSDSTDTNVYIKEIPQGTMVIDKSQNDAAEGDIFEDIITDTSLHQLPADIATNRTPNTSGDGGALMSIKMMDQHLNGANEYFRTEVDNYMTKGNNRFRWLSKSSDKNISVFDFTPRVKSKIQFRPLKAEVFDALYPSVYNASHSEDVRGSFGNRAWRETLSKTSPIAEAVRDRWDNVDGGVLKDGGARGFRFSYDDLRDSPNLSQSSTFYPQYYWDSAWQNNRPAGAFGIIGASCTVSANSTITFVTQSIFGMDDYYINGVRLINPSYGGDNNSYYSRNNQALHVRVFQAWPKELTIYDPRFFAVHHFNPGVGDPDILPITKNAGVVPVGYPDGEHITYQQQYDSDIQIPTKIHPSNEGNTTVTLGDKVYDNDVADPIWRDKADWNYNTSLRGALLPATTTIPTIGIGVNSQIEYANLGEDYEIGNTFTVYGEGSGVILRVNSLTANKGIDGFEIVDGGRGYSHADFFTKKEIDDEDYSYSKATSILTPISVNGKDAQIYILNGEIVEAEYTFNKPSQAGSNIEYKLSPTPALNSQEDLDFETRTNKETTKIVTINNKSADGQYDLFFHFYNDISHVFLEQWNDGPTSREQYMELEITPV